MSYIVQFGWGDSRAWESFPEALEFYRALRIAAAYDRELPPRIVGGEHDAECDGLTDEEREMVSES